MSTPVLIWGAGAIGGTLGAAFVRAGRSVVFVDNAVDHVRAINDTGLKIEGPIWRDTIKASAFLPEELEGKFDRVFLCVKALHTVDATRLLQPHLADDGFVVSAQNGLNEHEISGIVGATRTVGCFVNFGADYIGPGVVHYSGRGAAVIGEIDGSDSARIRDLHSLMCQFDQCTILTDNIWGYLWGKLIYGALLFATALTNDSIADVLDNAQARPLLTELAQEVGRVAASENVKTESFDGFDPSAFAPGATTAALNKSFSDMVAHNRRSTKDRSGIWRDLAVRKRKTEAKAQLGPIISSGADNGIQTPLTIRLLSLIEEIEAGTRPLSLDNLKSLEETSV